MDNSNIIKQINDFGYITNSIRIKYFRNYSEEQIRNWLSDNGLERDLIIEQNIVEVAVVTPQGLLMKIKDNRLEFFKRYKTESMVAKDQAIKLLEEEGIKVNYAQMDFFSIARRYLMNNAGSERILANLYRFKVIIDYIPELTDVYVLPYVPDYYDREFADEILNFN